MRAIESLAAAGFIPKCKKGAPLRGRLYKRGVFAGAQGAEIRLSANRRPAGNPVTLTSYSSPRSGDTTTLSAKGAVKPKNPPAKGRSILRTFCARRAQNPLDLLYAKTYNIKILTGVDEDVSHGLIPKRASVW